MLYDLARVELLKGPQTTLALDLSFFPELWTIIRQMPASRPVQQRDRSCR